MMMMNMLAASSCLLVVCEYVWRLAADQVRLLPRAEDLLGRPGRLPTRRDDEACSSVRRGRVVSLPQQLLHPSPEDPSQFLEVRLPWAVTSAFPGEQCGCCTPTYHDCHSSSYDTMICFPTWHEDMELYDDRMSFARVTSPQKWVTDTTQIAHVLQPTPWSPKEHHTWYHMTIDPTDSFTPYSFCVCRPCLSPQPTNGTMAEPLQAFNDANEEEEER